MTCTPVKCTPTRCTPIRCIGLSLVHSPQLNDHTWRIQTGAEANSQELRSSGQPSTRLPSVPSSPTNIRRRRNAASMQTQRFPCTRSTIGALRRGPSCASRKDHCGDWRIKEAGNVETGLLKRRVVEMRISEGRGKRAVYEAR
jgi:hypothetical protein